MAQAGVGTQTIIGDTLYMNMQGRKIKAALPKDTLSQWRAPARLDEDEATMTVQAQGSGTIDGVPADKISGPPHQAAASDVIVWLGNAGLPVQMQVDGNAQGQAIRTTIRYSHFNDPTLKVDSPQQPRHASSSEELFHVEQITAGSGSVAACMQRPQPRSSLRPIVGT